jgi:hypothetical protein
MCNMPVCARNQAALPLDGVAVHDAEVRVAVLTMVGAVSLLSSACGDVASSGSEGSSVRTVDRRAAVQQSSAQQSGAAEQPWIGPPWVLRSAGSTTWPADAPSPYEFCGRPYPVRQPVDVREQTLVHPSGRQAHLVELSPEGEDAIQLFKFSFAACLVPGQAESIGGPRNLWSVDAGAAGSARVGQALQVVTVTGPPAEPGTRAEVEALMDEWGA